MDILATALQRELEREFRDRFHIDAVIHGRHARALFVKVSVLPNLPNAGACREYVVLEHFDHTYELISGQSLEAYEADIHENHHTLVPYLVELIRQDLWLNQLPLPLRMAG